MMVEEFKSFVLKLFYEGIELRVGDLEDFYDLLVGFNKVLDFNIDKVEEELINNFLEKEEDHGKAE